LAALAQKQETSGEGSAAFAQKQETSSEGSAGGGMPAKKNPRQRRAVFRDY
jgi:hypothetical protein